MVYLITGATGLVGSELLRLCKEKGVVVHYFTTSKSKITRSDNCKGFYWNPAKGELDTDAFTGVSKIIHLAGATVAKRWTPCYKKEILASRIQSAALLYEKLSAFSHQITQFISASAIGIYPHSYTDLYSENDSSHKEDFFLGDVVKSWESSADQFSDLGIKVTKIRIGLVLSNDGGAFPKMVAPIKYYAGAAFGSGDQWQSWIHITDLAKLFLYVAKNNLEGIYNAVAPNAVTQEKLMLTCAKVLEKPLNLPNIPAVFLKLMLGEMHTLLLSSQRVSPYKIEAAGFKFTFPCVELAVKNLLA